MKIQRILIAAALASASGGAFAADVYYQATPATPAITAVPGERLYVQPIVPNGSPVHGGFVTDSDAQLLSEAVAVVNSDRTLPGSTATIVANNGELIVNGTVENISDGYRLENRLKRETGARVIAWWDPM
ncbi:MAG: hypothetical protein ACM3X5_05080 [Bacillota bacterium]